MFSIVFIPYNKYIPFFVLRLAIDGQRTSQPGKNISDPLDFI